VVRERNLDRAIVEQLGMTVTETSSISSHPAHVKETREALQARSSSACSAPKVISP
jgi:hypothetical protein